MAKFSYSDGLGTAGVWGYVPVGYRPTQDINFICHAYGESGWATGIGTININGQIKQTVMSSAKIIIFECEYIV